jgi:hypothetical protein
VQGVEGAAQLALEIFVVLVKGLDVLGWGSQVWFAGAGENGFDDFLAQDEPAVYSTQYSYSTKCEQGQRQLPDMLFNLF